MSNAIDRRTVLLRAGTVLLATPLATTLAACGSGAHDAVRPVAIQPEDTCARCGMLIGDVRQAAEILGADGQTWKFDDLAELFLFHRERHLKRVRGAFVHDRDTRRWVPAARATYVVGRHHGGPASSVWAFGARDNARAFAQAEHGTLRTFSQLLGRPAEDHHQH